MADKKTISTPSKSTIKPNQKTYKPQDIKNLSPLQITNLMIAGIKIDMKNGVLTKEQGQELIKDFLKAKQMLLTKEKKHATEPKIK